MKERCGIIAETLRFRGLASEQELAAYLPGGSENDQANELEAWIFTVSNYTRLCDRIPDPGESSTATRESEDAVIAALRDAPEAVTLSNSETVFAYPKSFDALDFIAQRDRRITWLVEQRDKVAQRAIAKQPGLLDAIGNEITYQFGLIVWAATHEGPSLPFKGRVPPEDLPEWIERLSPNEYTSLNGAFVRVNAVRLWTLHQQLDARLGKDGDKPSSWQTFFATRSEDAHVGADVLMRDRSLPSQLAAALLTADARALPHDESVS